VAGVFGRWRCRWNAHPPTAPVVIGFGNLFPIGISVTVALAPERAALASGRAGMMTSFAVLLAPLTAGTLADATSLMAALAVCLSRPRSRRPG
jgi:hypothetical protein